VHCRFLLKASFVRQDISFRRRYGSSCKDLRFSQAEWHAQSTIAQCILELVKNALQFLKQQGLSYENGFDTIEKTGLLGHYFRCIPVDSERAADTIVSLLLKGLQLVKKKLKSGTPTGDILDAVIAGEDKPINENVKAGLAKIQSLARLSNDHYDYKCGDTIKMCRRCEKVGAEMDGAFLMTCQRCKVTYYCSKECQVANWKSHQKMCYALGRGNESRSAFKTSHTSMRAFIGSRYFAIAKEVYKKTQDHDVPKKKLLVEIDFLGDAPALRNEFNVWLPSDFLKGSSVTDAPDWFRTFDDKKAKKYLAKYVKEKCTQVGSDDLLIVCRAYNGAVTVQRSHFLVANADYQLLSDEAVESIGRQDCARMVACLGKDKTDEYFRELRNSLT
jgi:hypothetical protein